MEKNMQINFQYLKERVKDSLQESDLDQIRWKLSRIKEPTLVSGVGGSSVVSTFTSKVLNQKNGIISINSEPRDFLYRRDDEFKNVIACSYSGNNYGVDLSFLKDLKKYLLSNHSFEDPSVEYLEYKTTIDRERSFISLGATLIPISILMDYYCDGKDDEMLGMIEERKFQEIGESPVYEIFTGYDTETASKYLESTMVEAELGMPIVHDKYSYCHGRSTFGTNFPSTIIYFNRNTEFDQMMLEELKKYHKTIIRIDSRYQDQVLDDYQMLIQSMYLTKRLAESQEKDLSKIKYSPIVEKTYSYKGNI